MKASIIYKLFRILDLDRILLQFRFPPKFAYCVICNKKTLLVRTDKAPRIGNRCLSCHSTAHHRGVFSVICEYFGNDLNKLSGCSVYEISQHGALYKKFSKIYAEKKFEFYCSEFDDSLSFGQIHNGIRNENIESLSFEDNKFDLCTSTGVMEHVENDIFGFREIYRCLKPGGLYIFTVPFSYNRKKTKIRAIRISNSNIKYLCAKEYHGDPFRGERGVFTWRNYGVDILGKLENIGFETSISNVTLPNIDEPMPVFVVRKVCR